MALTGGIATGKSYVRGQFSDLGIPTIDADLLARRAVAPGTPGLTAVAARFGPGILDPAGTLDRRRLGALVFADADARRDLEEIVHPFVRTAIDEWFAALDPARHAFGVAEIPLLYETGRERDFEAVIVAACSPDVQLHRVMARDQLSEEEAARRIAAQMPIDQKARRAEYVVRTDGTFDETNRQVRLIAESLA